MAQISRPWAGTTVGDAGPYTAPNWWDVWQAITGSHGAMNGAGNRGIFNDSPGQLEVTYVGPNFLSVGVGAAIVDGLFYRNTAAISVTVTSATAGNVRDDRLVIRKYFSGLIQTARLVLVSGSEVASPGPGTPPALVQDTARQTYWDLPLARVSITDAGVITLTDEREFVGTYTKHLLIPATHVQEIPGGLNHYYSTNIPELYMTIGTQSVCCTSYVHFPSDYVSGPITAQVVINPVTEYTVPPPSEFSAGNVYHQTWMSRRNVSTTGSGTTSPGSYSTTAVAVSDHRNYLVTIGDLIADLGMTGPDELFALYFSRHGQHANDTYGFPIAMLGFLLTYMSR